MLGSYFSRFRRMRPCQTPRPAPSDHDLGGEDTIRPVIDLMLHLANTGPPLNVGEVHIHTANVGAGHQMVLELHTAGYTVVRSYSLGMWTRDGR
jgi:hypothetical protein